MSDPAARPGSRPPGQQAPPQTRPRNTSAAGSPPGPGESAEAAETAAAAQAARAEAAQAEAAGAEAEAGQEGAPAQPEAARADGAAARIAELEDERLRARADLDNLRKRCASQISRAELETRARVALEWLPVVDNLERALSHADADPASVVAGIRAIRDEAYGVLARLGYPRRDDDLGAEFDPARHEAIASRPAPDTTDGSVVEVVRPGYGAGERQLRPAQVVVARSR